MPLYRLVRVSKKARMRGVKRPRPKCGQANSAVSPDATPCHTVPESQECDEEEDKLGTDARVWKTYVREVDQADTELVNGWSNSMDVILVPAALLSAISTSFVIESYKNLKEDPTELSYHTLLTISQTLAFIASGSQNATFAPLPNEGTTPFQVSPKDVYINVLWFLSLILSLAVTLISMLAKEWCQTFISDQTGSPAARRQRLQTMFTWRVSDIIVLLPMILHTSLVLFIIGLCIFLWDMHLGVTIPVVFVTADSLLIYLLSSILPLLYTHCPYATVFTRRYAELLSRTGIWPTGEYAEQDRIPSPAGEHTEQDWVTALALRWMIMNSKAPQLADIALQLLAGAGEGLRPQVLDISCAWTMVKRRFDKLNTREPSEQGHTLMMIYKRALKVQLLARRQSDHLRYGENDETCQLEQQVLGVQSCLNGAIHEIMSNSGVDQDTERVLQQCTMIAQNYLGEGKIVEYLPPPNGRQCHTAARELDPERLVQNLVQILEGSLSGKINLNALSYGIISASLAFALCCNESRKLGQQEMNAGYILRLIRAYNPEREARNVTTLINLVLGTLWILISSKPPAKSELCGSTHYAPTEKALEVLWAGLMITMYSDQSPMRQLDSTYLMHGGLHLLSNPNCYDINPHDAQATKRILCDMGSLYGLSREIQTGYHAQYIQDITHNLNTLPDATAFTTQFIMALDALVDFSPWEQPFLLPTPEIYMFLVKSCLNNPRNQSAYLIRHCPLPKYSPRLIQICSAQGIITSLSKLETDDDLDKRTFAIAQHWLLIDLSLREPDRTDRALNALETALPQHPRPENDLPVDKQKADELETRLAEILDQHSDKLDPNLRRFLYRVLEIMLQRRGDSLSQSASRYLEDVPGRLRGTMSFMNLETERTVA